jgi:hypothetical protein
MASKKEPLSFTHPDLAGEANGWDPSEFTQGSDQKVLWTCEAGHNWSAAISSRVGGNGCPVCSGHQILVGFNDLATTHPDLAKETDGWDPTVVSRGSHKKLNWICKFGHQWKAEVKSRALIGAGCPYCDGKLAVSGVNDLATLFPGIAAQARGWDPSVVKPTSHKKLEFECSLGHRYLQSVRRCVEATGCPVCQNDRVLVGFNDLATTHPELSAQAEGWDLTTVTAGTSKKLLWKCGLGHQWRTGITNRTRGNGTGCPYCSGRFSIVGETDLATTHPDLAAEAVGWDPAQIKAGTNKKLKWRCTKGHEWFSTPSSRSSGGSGCPFCSGLRVIPGETDLATTHPEIAAEAVGWDPTTISAGNDVKRRWRCQRDHEWEAQPYSRTGQGTGCPFCSGRRVVLGETDLATTHPEIAAEAVGWDPTTIGFGSGKYVKWQCNFGHHYTSRISHRTYMNSACPTCSQTGFDQNKNGWIYLIEQEDLQMFQVGISNFLQQRLDKHSKGGWKLIEVRGPMKGHLAQQLETAILHAVEYRGAVLGHKAQIKKFDGYSEAWTKESLNVTSIKQLLDWVYEDESK